jgi:hypothetical protein
MSQVLWLELELLEVVRERQVETRMKRLPAAETLSLLSDECSFHRARGCIET